MSIQDIKRYQNRMTSTDLWPSTLSGREDGILTLGDFQDPTAEILKWKSNGNEPMDDMLAALLVLGLITEKQAEATSDARATSTAAFLAAYRANPPQLTAEDIAEMRAAFGPGVTVEDVISGQQYSL